jgi:mono/diheme cytochrome c family protein
MAAHPALHGKPRFSTLRNAARASLFLFVAICLRTLVLDVAQAATADPASQARRGEYLVRAGDCMSCHTAPGGKPFAGGSYMPTPFGQLSVPNITPDKSTGIGDWTDEQFYRAMHEGIGRAGEYLYPVFPFPVMAGNASDGCDVAALRSDKRSGTLQRVTDVNMEPTIEQLSREIGTSAAHAKADELVNRYTGAYCGVLKSRNLTPAARAASLGNFSFLLYSELQPKKP